jgi:hypothetical protein
LADALKPAAKPDWAPKPKAPVNTEIAPKREAPANVEAPKPEIPRRDAPLQELLRPAPPKQELVKQEPVKQEAAKPLLPLDEPPKQELPKPDATPVVEAAPLKLDEAPKHLPPAKQLTPPPVREVQATLLEPPSTLSSTPPAGEGRATMRKPAHEVLDSILQRKVPPHKPPVVAAPTEPRVGPLSESTAPKTQKADEASDAVVPTKTRIALVPHRVTDAREMAEAAMPGMGEVLAGSGQIPITHVSPESRPLLHVPFLPVKSAPATERLARMAHWWNIGIICFILVDVLAVVIYKDKIADFLWGRSKPEQAAASEETAPGRTLGSPPAPTESPQAATIPEAVTQSAPVESTPALAVPATPQTSGSTPATPSESAAKSSQPPSGSVPIAIPLSGLSAQHPPVPPPPTEPVTPAPAEPKTTPTVPTPPAPPATALSESPTLSISSASNLISVVPGAVMPPPVLPSVASIPAPSAVPAVESASTSTPATSPTPEPETNLPPPALPTVEPIAPTPPPTPPSARKVGKVSAEAKTALEALEKFLDAPDWRARLEFVQKPDAVRAAMEKHAEKGDGPLDVGRIEFVERYPSRGAVPPYCMFELSGGSLNHPVLTLVEQSTKDGVRVDWEAFVEFKDDLLLRFLENKGAPPQKFRGLLRRKHYFDKDVPDKASKDSFELAQPNAQFEGHVFVPRNSALGKQLANQLPWNQDMPVIAELVWKSDAKTWWVQIESIVSYGWRG